MTAAAGRALKARAHSLEFALEVRDAVGCLDFEPCYCTGLLVHKGEALHLLAALLRREGAVLRPMHVLCRGHAVPPLLRRVRRLPAAAVQRTPNQTVVVVRSIAIRSIIYIQWVLGPVDRPAQLPVLLTAPLRRASPFLLRPLSGLTRLALLPPAFPARLALLSTDT